MDENIDESPEEEYSEEIVTFEIPIKADVQERSTNLYVDFIFCSSASLCNDGDFFSGTTSSSAYFNL
jgi:hypothetical protein